MRAGGGEVGGGGWWEGKRQDGVTNSWKNFYSIKFFLVRKKFALRRWPITAHNAINVPDNFGGAMALNHSIGYRIEDRDTCFTLNTSQKYARNMFRCIL